MLPVLLRAFGLCALSVFSYIGLSVADETPSIPKRYALILENSAYAQPLKNPQNDAALMTSTLQKLGFEIRVEHNLTNEQFYKSTQDFSQNLAPGAVALVYYAGHGMQLNNSNFLVPVDIELTGEKSAPQKAFPLEKLIERLNNAPSAVNMVILDACRNNPFRPSGNQNYRDFSNLGLAKMTVPHGMVIAFSTAPGQYAADGKGRSNSLYTETLAHTLQTQGLTIETALKNVATVIRKQTMDDQQPWFETSLVDDFYFIPPPGVTMLTKAKSTPTGVNLAGNQSRGMNSSQWFLALSAKDWASWEDQLEKRVQHLTEDEIPELKYRAENGNVIAMTTLGLAYRTGFLHGIDDKHHQTKDGANNSNSLYWLQQASEAGFPIAQLKLAEMYLQGIGTETNESLGMDWLEKASQSTYPTAKIVFAQYQSGIDPNAELTADEQLKTLQILMKIAKEHKY